MRTGPVSPQPPWGLTCSSQLPLSLPQYIQFILFFPVSVSSDKTRLFEISFYLSCLCVCLSLPKARCREMGRLVVVKGNPILGKPWVTPAPAVMIWGGEEGWCWTWLYRKGMMFSFKDFSELTVSEIYSTFGFGTSAQQGCRTKIISVNLVLWICTMLLQCFSLFCLACTLIKSSQYWLLVRSSAT